MDGKEVAEKFWGVLRARGFQVMDGDWAATTEPLKAAWNEFATDLNEVPAQDSDELLEFVLNSDEKFRQKLYELLYAQGHRIHS